MTVDWTKPVETNEGIAVEVLRFDEKEPNSGYAYVEWVEKSGAHRMHWFLKDGRSNVDDNAFIRNVQPAAVEPPVGASCLNTKPPYQTWTRMNRKDDGRKWVLSTDNSEWIEASLVQRMMKFVRYTASLGNAEARAIVAELPEPVDADLLEARLVASEQCLSSVEEAVAIRRGENDQCATVQLALAAIKRGRALERGEP